MSLKIKKKTLKRIITLLIVFFISFFVAFIIREQYPILKLESELISIQQENGHLDIQVPIHENYVRFDGEYEGTTKCMTYYTNILIDNTRINEEDLFAVNAFWDCWFCNEKLYAGTSEDELFKIKPNFWGQEIGKMYYKDGANKIYTKFCFDLTKIKKTHKAHFEVDRPVINSFRVSLSTFIIIFGFLLSVIQFTKHKLI